MEMPRGGPRQDTVGKPTSKEGSVGKPARKEGIVGKPTRKERIELRHRVGRELAARHHGVARRADLLSAGLTDHDIRAEVARGVWHRVGTHTICIEGREPSAQGRLWWALWESGPRAVLDGPTALIAAGLSTWEENFIHVSVPGNATVRQLPGVRLHRLRDLGPRITAGLRRTRPEVAVVRAAQWARTDREAATLVAMTVQRRLTSTELLLARWKGTVKSQRRDVLDEVIRDVCDGAHSITELDVGAACRRRGLPIPTRQQVRSGRNGRVYLDLWWDEFKVHVEIQGAHHMQGLAGVEDAVRSNHIAIQDHDVTTLEIPVLGWRMRQGTFLDQIEGALRARGWTAAA
ncbi:type IV toxin-antitoxin system AbiEi family antitoxin domain-containing protein [Ornithinimicrobium sp. Y1847]